VSTFVGTVMIKPKVLNFENYEEEFKLTIVKLAESGQPTKVLSEE
jgi:hypothetical protein